MRWTTPFIAACWLAASAAPRAATAPPPGPPRAIAPAVRECLGCHAAAGSVLEGVMATREPERRFARRAFGHAQGDRFFEESCSGCHVSTCSDCHGADPHPKGKPEDAACLRCHRGYFVGWDYHGRAPREDHERYRREPIADGEPYLKMLPDIHLERGLGCADCHSPHAAVATARTKTCVECHPRPAPEVPDHAIAAHLERMECVACHAAWAAQEYGTFLVRAATPEQQEAFAPLPTRGPWRKSAYLKRQDVPPLGLNERGLVAPIRPEFIVFATDARQGWENHLLVAEWRAFAPHTVRRGSVGCAGCHEAPRRYLLERDEDRLYLLDQDGLALRSFWSREGQSVRNGEFLPESHYALMNRKTPEYVRQQLKQWQKLLERVDRSSAR